MNKMDIRKYGESNPKHDEGKRWLEVVKDELPSILPLRNSGIRPSKKIKSPQNMEKGSVLLF